MATTEIDSGQVDFWSLWEATRPRLFRLCLRWLDNRRDEAEDALSDTMVRAWDNLPRLSGSVANPAAWLAGIAHHVCMDWGRRRTRDAALQDEARRDCEAAEVEPDELAEEGLVRSESYEQILRLVDALPGRQRDVFILHAFRGLPSTEIGAQLHMSDDGVRQRLYVARQTIRKQIEAHLESQEEPAGASGKTTEGERDAAARASRLEQRATAILGKVSAEIRSTVTEVRNVQLLMPTGIARTLPLLLERHAPTRETGVQALRAYVAKHPGGWKKRLELATALFVRGECDEAIIEYRHVTEMEPKLLDGWMALGRALELTERLSEAIAAYDGALLCTQVPATQHYIRAKAAICRGDDQVAADEFRQAAALEPDNVGHHRALAWVHWHTGHPCEEVQAYDEVLQRAPDDLVALVGSYDGLEVLGQWEELDRRLSRAVELDPTCALGLRGMAWRRCDMWLLRGPEGRATERLIRRALKLAPDDADTWSLLAHFHMRQGEWQEAVDLLRQFVEQHPNSPMAWYHYGLRLLHVGDYDQAAAAVTRLRQMDPAAFRGYWLSCEVLPYAGDIQSLDVVVAEMLLRFPGRWDACRQAAQMMGRWLGRPEEACAVARRATELQPNLPQAWFAYTAALQRSERYDEAALITERVWEWLPENGGHDSAAPAAICAAECWLALGDQARAARWYEAAGERARKAASFGFARGEYWLGLALEALGEPAAAEGCYQAALDHQVYYWIRQDVEAALARVRAMR